MFGQGNQNGDAFAPKALSSEAAFGSPTASTWAFSPSPASSTTTFGVPSYTGYGSSASALGFSSNFGSPSVSAPWNQRGDSFAQDRANVFCFPINSHGTSPWTLNQTSSTQTTSGAPSSHFSGSSTSSGPHATRSAFDLNQSQFGGQERGSRIQNYKSTPETECTTVKLESISAMPVYQNKSHEELRWEDYKLSKKGEFGSSSSPVKSTSFTNFPTNSWGTTSVSTTPPPMKPLPNPFGKPFHTETPTWKFPGPTSTSQPLPFSLFANNSFTTLTPTPSLNLFNSFSPKTNLSTASTSFKSLQSPPTPQPLASLNQHAITNPFTSLSTQTCSSSFSSCPTSAACTPGVVMIRSSLDDVWSTAIGAPSISMVTTPANSVPLTFNQPTTLFPRPSTQNYNGEITGTIGQMASPFGTLPPKPHLSFEGSPSTPSVQFGISSIPVKDKPALVRYPPFLTARHLSRNSKLPLQKYDPKPNGSKMPFFSDTKEIPVPVLVPRENPRALIISPETCPPKSIIQHTDEEKSTTCNFENEQDDPTEENKVFPTVLDVPPKLKLSGYYTKPEISEMESKERAEPGYCSHVKDFVIGRHGYGCIKFLGDTDVRKLDLESYVEFNKREVVVYKDGSKKHPVGQGLNKPAEITLLNIKCMDKRRGVEYKDAVKIDRYREMLKKKVATQGGEFVSYDPVEGEWKFRVQHF